MTEMRFGGPDISPADNDPEIYWQRCVTRKGPRGKGGRSEIRFQQCILERVHAEHIIATKGQVWLDRYLSWVSKGLDVWAAGYDGGIH
jgi:hypothetical protein